MLLACIAVVIDVVLQLVAAAVKDMLMLFTLLHIYLHFISRMTKFILRLKHKPFKNL